MERERGMKEIERRGDLIASKHDAPFPSQSEATVRLPEFKAFAALSQTLPERLLERTTPLVGISFYFSLAYWADSGRVATPDEAELR
jgi:hypothetical protein